MGDGELDVSLHGAFLDILHLLASNRLATTIHDAVSSVEAFTLRFQDVDGRRIPAIPRKAQSVFQVYPGCSIIKLLKRFGY